MRTQPTVNALVQLVTRTQRSIETHGHEPNDPSQHQSNPTKCKLFPPCLSRTLVLDPKSFQYERRGPERSRITPDDPPIPSVVTWQRRLRKRCRCRRSDERNRGLLTFRTSQGLASSQRWARATRRWDGQEVVGVGNRHSIGSCFRFQLCSCPQRQRVTHRS